MQQYRLLAATTLITGSVIFRRCTTIDPRPRKLNRAQHLVLQRRGIKLPAKDCHLRAQFGPALWDDPTHAALLANCSLVVGMHPDQVILALHYAVSCLWGAASSCHVSCARAFVMGIWHREAEVKHVLAPIALAGDRCDRGVCCEHWQAIRGGALLRLSTVRAQGLLLFRLWRPSSCSMLKGASSISRFWDVAMLRCRLFHDRRLEGKPVTTHAQLVDYLRTKAPAAQVAQLPFEGQNHCLYLSA